MIKAGERIVLPAISDPKYGDPLPEQRGIVLEVSELTHTIMVQIDESDRQEDDDDGLVELSIDSEYQKET